MSWRERIGDYIADLDASGANLGRPMRVEFYFADHHRAPLEKLSALLVARGYQHVEIWDPDPSNDDAELMFLHCEIAEQLTEEQLSIRCDELESLAHVHGVEAFDGFDVSHLDGSVLFPSGD